MQALKDLAVFAALLGGFIAVVVGGFVLLESSEKSSECDDRNGVWVDSRIGPGGGDCVGGLPAGECVDGLAFVRDNHHPEWNHYCETAAP